MDDTAKLLKTVAENEKKVFEAGEKAGDEAFVRMYTNNYTRTDYGSAFQYSDFSGYTFPKTIKPTNIYAIFQNYKGVYIPNGLDCSGVVSSQSAMQFTCRYASSLKVFPDINIPVMERYAGTWQGCEKLETIELIRCDVNSEFSSAFSGCYGLKNVTFDGMIGKDISFSNSWQLTKGCFEHIVSHLSDAAIGKTATFSSAAKTTAFSNTEWSALIATKPNWTFSLV